MKYVLLILLVVFESVAFADDKAPANIIINNNFPASSSNSLPKPVEEVKSEGGGNGLIWLIVGGVMGGAVAYFATNHGAIKY